ncbi:putative membrane protein [Clostridioides difficile P28]|nr:putative membrane protein [Clostridioides difficile P28]
MSVESIMIFLAIKKMEYYLVIFVRIVLMKFVKNTIRLS